MNPAELEAAIAACVADVAGGETSLGDALREYFAAATTGDESPDTAREYMCAVERCVRAWVGLNVPAGE